MDINVTEDLKATPLKEWLDTFSSLIDTEAKRVMVASLLVHTTVNSIEEGEKKGYEIGHGTGYEAGYSKGLDTGYDEGFKDGVCLEKAGAKEKAVKAAPPSSPAAKTVKTAKKAVRK